MTVTIPLAVWVFVAPRKAPGTAVIRSDVFEDCSMARWPQITRIRVWVTPRVKSWRRVWRFQARYELISQVYQCIQSIIPSSRRLTLVFQPAYVWTVQYGRCIHLVWLYSASRLAVDDRKLTWTCGKIHKPPIVRPWSSNWLKSPADEDVSVSAFGYRRVVGVKTVDREGPSYCELW